MNIVHEDRTKGEERQDKGKGKAEREVRAGQWDTRDQDRRRGGVRRGHKGRERTEWWRWRGPQKACSPSLPV